MNAYEKGGTKKFKKLTSANWDPTENLLLNIMGGLDEKHLSNKERGLLKRKFGKNWKKKVFGQ